MTILGFDVGGRAGTTMSCLYISAEAEEEMPKIKKAGGISRFLDAPFYRNNITENYRSVELTGPTGHHVRPPYAAGPEKLPLALQDHNHPVRYRDIWLRELK